MNDSNSPSKSEDVGQNLPADDLRLSLLDLSWELRAHLCWLHDAGVYEMPQIERVHLSTPPPAERCAHSSREQIEPDRPTPSAKPRPSVCDTPYIDVPTSLADSLEALLDLARTCERCSLSKSRMGVVLGNGVMRSDLIFVGERPMTTSGGEAGLFSDEVRELLEKMIRAMGLSPDEVACAHVIQCASSAEDPLPFDAPVACRPFLWTQIRLIRPKVIVALGKVATQALLQVSTPITRIRGQWQNCGGIRLMPTFHPAYLLKNPDAKRQAWLDLQQVISALKD